ncbi:MAG: OmpA family protein [Methylotenera sp.]|nr:OmpA family protein [Oligoflexia bacterium]
MKTHPSRIRALTPTSSTLALLLPALIAGAVTAPSAFAQDFRESHAAPSEVAPRLKDWIYIGADVGKAWLSTDFANEADKKGTQYNLKLLESHYWNEWLLDLGAGYFYNELSGGNAQGNRVVKTRALLIEVSPRYRIPTEGMHWQIGPVVNALFGADVSFDETEAVQEKKFTLIGGLRAQYETGGEASRWRFGVQAMNDLNIAHRNVQWLQADIQFGFPWEKSGKSRPAPAPAAPSKPVVARATPHFAEIKGANTVKIHLSETILHFKSGSHTLAPSSERILNQVATYLKNAPDAWKTMRIEGHTDRIGKHPYNMKLSDRRAGALKKRFTQLGLPGSHMTTQGFGPDRPIDVDFTPKAFARNRRAELWLDGVMDPETLTKDMNEIGDLSEIDEVNSNH